MGSKCQFGKMMATVAWIGMIASPLLGERIHEARRQNAVPDVILGDQGVLRGQVVDSDGKPLAEQSLLITRDGKRVAEVRTDERGRFQASSSGTGVYRLVVGEQQQLIRGWDARIAPPAATPAVLVVSDDAIRGQAPCACTPACPPGCTPLRHRLACVFGNPWILGLGIATAVAVPLALNNDDDDTVRANGNGAEGEPDDVGNGS